MIKNQNTGGGFFSLLKGLRKKKKQQLKILVLGLDNAGKTSILKSLCNQDLSTVTPTHGFNIKSLTHEKFKLHVWDIGGQKILREHWSSYISNIDGLVYVVDSADIKRVKQSGQQLQNLLLQKQLSGIPLLLFANKQDLSQALQPVNLLQQLKIGQIKTRNWTIGACSAKTLQGIQQGLTWLIQNIKK